MKLGDLVEARPETTSSIRTLKGTKGIIVQTSISETENIPPNEIVEVLWSNGRKGYITAYHLRSVSLTRTQKVEGK
tara:strand:- start:818 stop:1045 length:228 start_codon:yes stop_codon:yes gene_type:complete